MNPSNPKLTAAQSMYTLQMRELSALLGEFKRHLAAAKAAGEHGSIYGVNMDKACVESVLSILPYYAAVQGDQNFYADTAKDRI